MDRKFLNSVTIALAILALTAAPLCAQDEDGYTSQIVQVDTSQFPVISVYVSVTDAAGNPVSNLDDSTFSLEENDQPMQITEVFQAGEQGPVSAVLTIDRSGSMLDAGKLDAAKAAATAFVDLMRPEDQTGVVVFNTQVEVIQPLTSDKEALRQAIAGIEAFDDTAMYNALSESVAMLEGVEGRKAIILLSDGLDNSSNQTAQDIINTVGPAEISIYSIGLGDPSAGTGSMAGIDEDALRAIAEESRGTYTYTPDAEALTGMYEQLSLRLQNEYRITYTSPNTLRDGVARGLQVTIRSGAAESTAETGAVEAGYNPGGLIPETAEVLSWPVFGALLVGLLALLALPGIFQRSTGPKGAPAGKRGKSKVKLTKAVPPTAPAPSAKPAAKQPRVRTSKKQV